jgi:microcystin-dependent protein
MAEPFLGEIRMMSIAFAPKGWALCNGQLLPINQNQALFSLLGTMYGGDGRTNFALPDFRGRTPVHVGTSDTGTNFAQGQRAGSENHTLNSTEMPQHTHNHLVSSAAGAVVIANNNAFGNSAVNLYATQNGGATMSPLGNTGGNQSHSNMQPYSVINFCIATQGIFPSRT